MGTTSPQTFIESLGTKVRAPLAVPILERGIHGWYKEQAKQQTK